MCEWRSKSGRLSFMEPLVSHLHRVTVIQQSLLWFVPSTSARSERGGTFAYVARIASWCSGLPSDRVILVPGSCASNSLAPVAFRCRTTCDSLEMLNRSTCAAHRLFPPIHRMASFCPIIILFASIKRRPHQRVLDSVLTHLSILHRSTPILIHHAE